MLSGERYAASYQCAEAYAMLNVALLGQMICMIYSHLIIHRHLPGRTDRFLICMICMICIICIIYLMLPGGSRIVCVI